MRLVRKRQVNQERHLNQIYRISEADLEHKLNNLSSEVKVIELFGNEIPDLDIFLNQCIQKFKLPIITPEEDEDEQFPDYGEYDFPNPLLGLGYALRDLSNVSDFPQQPIMIVIHDAMHFLSNGNFNDVGIVLNEFLSSLFSLYDRQNMALEVYWAV